MGSIELITVCLVAFAAVFILLSILALIMRAIVAIFPERRSGSDQAIYAAIASTYQSLYPGTKVTRIEEIP
ncbi:hypothetical protein GF420_10865 [candidate division GN15 bacterium]|nr:hypothetical protein [candidate division GN15 bacterium]